MLNKEVDMVQMAHCKWGTYGFRTSVPVCRDQLLAQSKRIKKYKHQDFEFERVEVRCHRCPNI